MNPNRLLIIPWIDLKGRKSFRLVYFGNWWTRVIAKADKPDWLIDVYQHLARQLDAEKVAKP